MTAQRLDEKPSADEIEVFGITHPGHVRVGNQDHFLVATLGASLIVHQTSLPELADPGPIADVPADERVAFLAVVSDGVGSGAWGEEASRTAVEAVTRHVVHSVRDHFAKRGGDPTAGSVDPAALSRTLEEAALRSHAEILRRAEETPERRGMAATLTVWLGMWPHAWVLQVGDSRCYRYSDGDLLQVSRDQTVAQELIDNGVLSPDVAVRTRWAHVLSSSVGGPASVPVVTSMFNDRGSVHLLCSDGLTRYVSDARIAELLASMTSARQVCEQLLQEALDGGGADNITIVVGRARARHPS